MINDQIEGSYEFKKVKLEKGDYVIDAGANVGMFPIFASQRVNQKGKVFSFEPIPRVQKLLRRNIKLNGIKNTELIPFALGEEKAKLRLSVPPNNKLAASSGFFDRGGEEIKAKQISLDHFVEQNDLPKVDFIKADIEGMERNFLRGAKEVIKIFKPKIAVCIYHRPNDFEIIKEIISEFVPDYNFVERGEKMYAWVPENL